MIIGGEGQALLAFHAAKREIQAVHKSEEADMGKYTVKYASLNAVLAECERACGLHNLVITQEPTIVEGMFAVLTTLIHSDASYLIFAPMCLPHPKEAQAVGSASTYLRRYSLVAQFGIPVEDDDGKAATVAAQVQPGRRTEAERVIREHVAGMDSDERKAFVADFKEEFRVPLADLPANRHGDALTWTVAWRKARAMAADAPGLSPAQEDAADAAWVAAAQGEEPRQ